MGKGEESTEGGDGERGKCGELRRERDGGEDGEGG